MTLQLVASRSRIHIRFSISTVQELPPQIRIVVTHGVDVARSFDIGENRRLIVGRGAGSDTRLTDPALSRVHFSVEHVDGRILVSDLGSLTGTFINGLRVDRNAEAESGDEISAGDCRLLLSVIGGIESDTIEPSANSVLVELNGMLGSSIGGYLLKRVIGVGRTGLVFEGLDLKKNRDVAVKVFSKAYTSEKKHRDRFVQGTRSFAKISDPHLIRLYKAGKSSSSHYYVAMELVLGENLESLIQRSGIEGMLDWKEVWRCAFQIGSALHATYEQNVIHRTVVTRNIIRRFSDRKYMLGDFTFAAPVDPIAQRLRSKDIVGELHYLPPERIPDASEQILDLTANIHATTDIRSDIFGLGATCYALLTGKPPANGVGMSDVIASIRSETPKPPTSVHLSVNDQFQGVVMQMIAKNPGDRFQTPQKLLKELGRIGRLTGLAT